MRTAIVIAYGYVYDAEDFVEDFVNRFGDEIEKTDDTVDMLYDIDVFLNNKGFECHFGRYNHKVNDVFVCIGGLYESCETEETFRLIENIKKPSDEKLSKLRDFLEADTEPHLIFFKYFI